jgi:hypothetical protein
LALVTSNCIGAQVADDPNNGAIREGEPPYSRNADRREDAPPNGLSIIGGFLAAGALVAGHFWGVATHYPGRPPSEYTTFAYFAGAWMFVGIPVSMLAPPRQSAEPRTKACIATMGYSIGVVAFEPFLVHNGSDIVVAYVVLLPLLWAIVYLVRVHGWFSAVGITLFVLTCSAMITSNANVRDAGSGFFSWWTS